MDLMGPPGVAVQKPPVLKLLSSSVTIRRPIDKVYICMYKGHIFACKNPVGVGLMTIRSKDYDCFSFRTLGNVSKNRQYSKPYLNIYIASPNGLFSEDNRYFVTEVLESDSGEENKVYESFNQVVIPSNTYITMFLNRGVLEVTRKKNAETPVGFKKILSVNEYGVCLFVRNPRGSVYRPPPFSTRIEMLVLFGRDDEVDIPFIR
jgi:hypothetical protein